MAIETFECQETIAEPVDIGVEAIALIDELGLAGQKTLITPDKPGEDAQRCPYRHIRADEQFVYGTLCPVQMPLERFSECPIPLRVLQVVAHAKSLGIFKKFEVWSAQGEVKDPVVVAYDTAEWNTRGHVFILARWGDVLDEWPILCQKALTAWRERCRSAYAKIKATIAAEEAQLDGFGMQEAINKEEPAFYGIAR